jgi:FG-GAP repeat
VYVFSRSGSVWAQQAYVKASNTGVGDQFGASLALSADGNTLAVGASEEAGKATGIGGDQNNNADFSGAVYVFSRSDSGSAWTQRAYVKASNTEAGDRFGASLALSADGATLAVGAGSEGGSATGIGGNQADNGASFSGAVYLY